MSQSKTFFNVDQVLSEIERAFEKDNTFLHTIDSTNIASVFNPTVSGLSDNDYLQFSQLANGFKDLVQIKVLSTTSLPSQIIQHSSHAQCNYMMGIFSEIHRAWLTIDKDLYVWSYEQGADVAYYDGVNETIIGVGLVKPKVGVFKSFIKYLLVLTTTSQIIVLGVTFAKSDNTVTCLQYEEMNLVPGPIFQLSSDEVPITVVKGSDNGRIFLGGRDGCLYELSYQGETRWFGKRCKKVNHSTGLMSYIFPSFINNMINEDDSISQIAIDNSSYILYTLSQKGSIEVYDMGVDGQSMVRVMKMSQTTIAHLAQKIANTIETINFSQIISVSAIEKNESKLIQLIGTTQTGVRFYFTVYDQNVTETQLVRPMCLKLVHIRLPPGFSGNFRSILPKNVYYSQYKQTNFLFVSNNSPDQHSLWCVNSDPFPANHILSEAYTLISLDGPVWDIAEVSMKSNLFSDVTLPPLLVRQHIEAPRKFVVLTTQSVTVILKSRPVDFLRQLLIENKGPDNNSVKTYFQAQGKEQACAICLILACLENAQYKDVANWATRAFFLYGSENVQFEPQNTSMITTNLSKFMPNLVSTPLSANHQQAQTQLNRSVNNFSTFQNPEDIRQFSAKHNALYLYVSRILRPLWYIFCVQKIVQQNSTLDFVVSPVNVDDFNLILSNLLSLKAFLDNYKIMKSSRELQQAFVFNKTLNTSTAAADKLLIEQQIEENKSIEHLYTFISHCSEIISLWKILNEHQFHALISSLSQEHKITLFSTTFKDLFLYGHDMCSTLIINLINSYLRVGASIDSISKKLREVCPNLYKREDAIGSKASQMLIEAKSKINLDEKDNLFKQALNLYKEVTPNLNLSMAVQKFILGDYYFGVIDLCVATASKLDPENLSVRYYKNNEPSDDERGFSAYMNKLNIYKEIVLMLNDIYNGNATQDNSDSLKIVLKLILTTLNYEDEILHVTIYDWMLKKKMYNELIAIKHESLEMFLLKVKDKNQDSVDICDLLWKYYEKLSNHVEAAVVLKQLAHSKSPSIDLSKRIDYLSRAVICARSCPGVSLIQRGIHTRDLEDKLDVIRTQKIILESILNLDISDLEKNHLTQRLNTELLDLSQLYNDFTEPYKLWECKLMLVSYSTNVDPLVVKQIWSNILTTERSKVSSNDPNERLALVLDKIHDLHRSYTNSEICFPINFILLEMEIWSCNLKANPSLVPLSFFKMGIKANILIETYSKIFLLNPDVWTTEESNFYICYAFVELLNIIKSEMKRFLLNEKLKIVGKAEDAVLGMLSYLYSRSNTEDIVQKLRQARTEFGAN